MLTLQRITSEYVATEDRFRLSGTTDKGGEVCYWVTQRLLLRLLGFLLDWLETHREQLERQAATEMLGPAVTKAAKPSARGTAEAARTEAGGGEAEEKEAGEAPEEDQAASGELLFEADIRIAPDHITLVFKPRQSEHAQLSLRLGEAWQWVAILHTLWQRAEWNLSAWPDWVEQVKAPHLSKSAGYLH